MLDNVKNFSIVTVSTGYDDTATTVVLAGSEGAKLPDPATANFNLVWWDSTNYSEPALDPNVEIVRCTGKSTDTLTVTRAQESTSGSTKNTVAATYKMALTVTAKMITDIGTDLDAKVTKALFDANTILAANSDNTPAAVTIGEQQIVGRITSGNIKGLSVAEARTLIVAAPGTSGNVLTSDGTNWTSAAPAGGGMPSSYNRTTNFTTTSTSYVDITGLSHAVGANKKYRVEIFLSGGDDEGILGFQLGAPTGTYAQGQFGGNSINIINRSTTMPSTSATLTGIFGVFLVEIAGTAGNITIQTKRVTGTTTVNAGSFMIIQEVS